MKLKRWIIDRLKERSTWLGVTGFLTAAGVALSPEEIASIAAFGLAFGGIIAAFTKDPEKKP